ncbi:MbtH family NRPS accessory protein [Bradyrhizobium sp. 21]|uniref:MbtH family NRPS accessory protein n=1 Tax=Bradyrhizobium sp. 21 TaxID=2782666 RepID=UPI001FF9E0B1|nr:MbtH family NRPS accessory protein [Bradyrhizobium sp. 21]MCK1387655.1 MbtH family NRPS accessory protein [Bradyrhizobium sp. 21]
MPDIPRGYLIVRNSAEQYSVWPEELALPNGWQPTSKAASLDECLAQVRLRWTDLKPACLSKKMDCGSSNVLF